MCPVDRADPSTFRITIGGDQCAQPYSASVFNISAMSFGSLGAKAIRALNKGAKLGGFSHDTGEGSISRYHREIGGDIVWEVASGYFGCRTPEGRSIPDRFAAQARNDQVKMIEIKLSQGAKPGHGGILPAAKVTPEISEARGVPLGVDCVSPAAPQRLFHAVGADGLYRPSARVVRRQAGGLQAVLGHAWEFMAIVKAMLETGIRPDFIVVDGGEGGTGAAPVEFSDHMGTPMREGLLLVHNTLVGAGLRDQIDRRGGQDRHALSISPASWPSAPIGQTPRAASCSRLAACSHCTATPTAARPGSPPRTRCASGRWWSRTRPSGSTTSTATR